MDVILNQDLLAEFNTKIQQIEDLKAELLDGVETSFKPLHINSIKATPTEIACMDFLPLIVGALNIIAGAGGVGKSMIGLRSAIHYLRANPMKKALLVFGEDDKQEIENRFKYLMENVFFEQDFDKYLNRIDFVTTDNPINMRFLELKNNTPTINAILVRDFEKYLQDENIGFVLLDPLKKFHSCNENDNSQMDLLVRDVFLNMASRLKAVFLVLHHKAKSSNGARGATTITDTARIAYSVAKKYKRNKEGELEEDEEFFGKVAISTIKDNKHIFYKYGRKNTNGGIIELFPKKVTPTYEEHAYEMPTV